jgi:hypothetical protein
MKCDRCRQETGKQAEQKTAVSYTTETGKEILIPYTLPLYCNVCQEDLEALAVDMTDLARVRREWHEYRMRAWECQDNSIIRSRLCL